MTAIDKHLVARLLADGDAATTTTARGRALEDVIAYTFEQQPPRKQPAPIALRDHRDYLIGARRGLVLAQASGRAVVLVSDS